MADKAGNTIADANRSAFRNLGAKPTVFKDQIGGNDFNDFLQVKFKNHSSLNVQIDGISTDLELQNRRGKVLKKAKDGQIQTTLKRGTYYLNVSRDPKLRIGATPYTLKASAYLDLAGNTLDTARPIEVSKTPSQYKDYVGTADPHDYYAFDLSADGGISLGLNSAKGAVQLEVLNADGAVLDSIVTKARRATATDYSGGGLFNLEEGNYYVRVTPKKDGINTSYTLTATSLGPADPAATAIQFAITNQTSQFRGTVKITGVVENIGDSLFDSNPGQQTVLLYEVPLGGNPVLVGQKTFEDLTPGQRVKVSYSREWDASSPSEGEFPPTYRVQIVYDPDILLDGNPFNDDPNSVNNQRDRSGSGINALFTN
jgi:hypothetical protein